MSEQQRTAINDNHDRAAIDPVFGTPYTPCRHWHDEGFVGGCEDCHRDEYIAEIIHLRSVIADAASELSDEHRPDWASDKARAAGKDPVWCVICGPADGSWPCISSDIADDLISGLDSREGRTVDDGFGSQWLKCRPGCGLQVVRPGKVQCDCENSGPLDSGLRITPGSSDENGSERAS